MPEGPVIVLYAQALQTFKGSTVTEASSTTKTIDPSPVEGLTITGLKTWGKYLFILFDKGVQTIRIHWGMFGSYRIDDEASTKTPKLTLHFTNGRKLRLYAVSLRLMEGPPSKEEYDPRADVMDKDFSTSLAIKKIEGQPGAEMICDTLMNQEIFAGVGNAIKNEALWARKIHPEEPLGSISSSELKKLIPETVGQSELFMEERKHGGEGRYPWTQVFRKRDCPRCGAKLEKKETGELKRISFWCPNCQKLSSKHEKQRKNAR